MTVWKRVLLASMLTAAVTLLLSVLPHPGQAGEDKGGDIAVFRSSPIRRLSSDNLVDSLLGLQLSLKIKKAEWRQAVLSLDLSVEETGGDIKPWMQDLQRLLYLSFVRMDNVNRLLVRYVEPAAGRTKEVANVPARYNLIAAADVRRSDQWLAAELIRVEEADPFRDDIWKRRLRMSYGSKMANRTN